MKPTNSIATYYVGPTYHTEIEVSELTIVIHKSFPTYIIWSVNAGHDY